MKMNNQKSHYDNHKINGGLICGYYPNTNEVVATYEYYDFFDRNIKWEILCKEMKSQGRGGVGYIFDSTEFNLQNWDEDGIAKQCAITSIKTLIELNNLKVSDIFELGENN